MKKLVCLLLCLVMTLSLFCGCGATETENVTKPSADENEKIVLATEGASSTDVVRGGTLVLAKNQAMRTGLDITRTDDLSNHYTVLAAIYESLLSVDENGYAAPNLATEWQIAEDGMSITLKLREDVSFSNGEKFNAEAVAKCINFYLSDACNHYYKATDLANFDSAEALEEYTVRINLNNTDAALEMKLASSVGFIMAPANIDNMDYATNPIGTGPFVLDEYLEGESITLTANPNYYKMGVDGKPLPYLDSVKLQIMTDDTTQLTNLKSGDVMGIDRLGSTSSVISVQKMDDASIYESTVTQTYNICANMSDETVGSNQALREAIAYATNTEEILDIALEGFGAATAFWSTPARWWHYDYNPYTYDLEKAKEKMAEAGYPDGLELELAIIAREPDNTIAQLVQSQLAEIGIKITINSMDSAAWVAYVMDARQQLSIALAGNAGHHPSRQWPSALIRMGTNDELEEIKSLLADAYTKTNVSDSYALVQKAQEMYLDNCMGVVLANKYYYGAFKSNVHNVGFHYYGWVVLEDAWIEN